MANNNKLPKRKHPRLKYFNYANNGNYFVTICTQNRKNIFSKIIEGAVVLSPFGEIVENELLSLEQRYPFLKIENFVIMPNHIHILFMFNHNDEDTAGASRPALHIPNLCGIVSTFKSLATRKINQEFNLGKIFQTSFYEHVINSQKDWSNTWDYIDNNPLNWLSDELYTD